MNLKISIITVAYNAESSIEDTIKSVLSQSYSNIEYIIIDGKSSDNTLEICNKYSDKISKIVSEKDTGIYDAMNKGVALAQGDVVGILNADDFYADNFVIENIVEKFKKEAVDAVYADLVYVNGQETSKVTRTWISGVYEDGMFLKGWMPPHPTFFVKLSCYKEYGDYSLDLKTVADYELMLRMIHKYKIKLGYLNKIIVKMRVGGVSNASLKNRIRAQRDAKKSWQMNGIKPNLFTLIMKPLSKVTQFFKK